MAEAQRILMLQVGLAALISLIVGYLSMGIFYSVMSSVDDFRGAPNVCLMAI